MEHKCLEKDKIYRLERIIDGNGRRGLTQEVTIIKEKVHIMEESLDSLSTSYKALVEADIERSTIDKLKAKAAEGRNKAIANVAAIIGAAGVIITAILTFG